MNDIEKAKKKCGNRKERVCDMRENSQLPMYRSVGERGESKGKDFHLYICIFNSLKSKSRVDELLQILY